jgi:hypothetical protein
MYELFKNGIKEKDFDTYDEAENYAKSVGYTDYLIKAKSEDRTVNVMQNRGMTTIFFG